MDIPLTQVAADLPDDLVREMRSNHAGETGAVWIYKGILAISRNREVREFAEHHLETERAHLQFFQDWLMPSQKSRLLPLWYVSGFLLGAVAGFGGRAWVYASIEAVETFVVRHYESQYAALEAYGDDALTQVIRGFCSDEADHRDEANTHHQGASLLLRAWCALVGMGSEGAVKIARRI